MNEKEKAIELVEKFIPHVYCYMGSGMLTNDYDERVAKSNAKQCALICVEEIMKNEEDMHRSDGYYFNYHFWKDVKTEIEAL